jgi:CheY-like chemotaxis protein
VSEVREGFAHCAGTSWSGGVFLASKVPVLSGARILVADDDRDLLEVIAAALEDSGAAVIRACNGPELIDRLADSGPFDLIVTDIAMRWLNGMQAMRAVRTAGLRTSVIVMTALPDESLPLHVDALGGHTVVLRKPFDLDDLRSAASQLLQRSNGVSSRNH